MFAGKARAYHKRGDLKGTPLGSGPNLLTNIRLGWKGFVSDKNSCSSAQRARVV
jgi:hypothetical protein